MALLSRVKSPDWQDGDILTATDLRAEFNNIVNGLNGASDISVLTLTTSGNATIGGNVSVTANVAITGGLSANTSLVSNPDRIGAIHNLGIVLASGLLSLTDRSGAALSSTNFGTVTMDSATAGVFQNIKLAANQTIRDEANATNDFDGVGFGITEANDWANDVPVFIYVVNKGGNNVADVDGNSAICISRNPAMKVTPASGLIGKKGSAPGTTDNQSSIVLWGSNYTVANYAALPVQLIGALRMRWTGSTTGWTFQTLGGNDGIGPEKLRKTFATTWSMPLAQMGAATGTFILANSGTAPLFTTNNYSYKLSPNGVIELFLDLEGDPGTDGVGAVTTQISMPFFAAAQFATSLGGSFQVVNATDGELVAMAQFDATNSYFTLVVPQVSTGNLQNNLDPVQNGDFTNGGRNIIGSLRYMAF